MYILKEQQEILEKAMMLLPSGDLFNALDKEAQDTIIQAVAVLVDLRRERKRQNRKTADYIAYRRETDKNYGRPPREWTKKTKTNKMKGD